MYPATGYVAEELECPPICKVEMSGFRVLAI
jgi:hypothetical protein